MTTFNLRRARLRSGEQLREDVDIELEPFTLGGQEYEPEPRVVRAQLAITKATTTRATRVAAGLVIRIVLELPAEHAGATPRAIVVTGAIPLRITL